MFADNAADIIISDWVLELDGISFIKRIRRAPESPDRGSKGILRVAE
jgi:hypothetical protein